MEQRFIGQSVIVTGGSSGYGLGLVRRFVAEGATVWATARDKARLDAAVTGLGHVHTYAGDVRSASNWAWLVDDVLEHAGRLDILVNNAGAGIRIAPIDEQTPTTIEDSLAINLAGAILGCRFAVPPMKEKGRGTIVNILSLCCREAWPGWSVYSAAKAGLQQFTNCLYVELREYGVRAMSVIPSWGATDFQRAAGIDPHDEVRPHVTQPDELGAFVADLCAVPPHLNVLDATVLPMIQEIVPL